MVYGAHVVKTMRGRMASRCYPRLSVSHRTRFTAALLIWLLLLCTCIQAEEEEDEDGGVAVADAGDSGAGGDKTSAAEGGEDIPETTTVLRLLSTRTSQPPSGKGKGSCVSSKCGGGVTTEPAITTKKSLRFINMAPTTPKMSTTCTPSCTKRKCAISLQNSKKFTSNGALIEPKTSAILVKGCGTQIIFGTKTMGAYETTNACCQYGLRAINFDSVEKMRCIEKLYKPYVTATIKLFWTRATDFQCATRWGWCDDLSSMDSGLWSPGSPDHRGDNKHCAALQFKPGKPAGMINLACLYGKASLLCEVPSGNWTAEGVVELPPPPPTTSVAKSTSPKPTTSPKSTIASKLTTAGKVTLYTWKRRTFRSTTTPSTIAAEDDESIVVIVRRPSKPPPAVKPADEIPDTTGDSKPGPSKAPKASPLKHVGSKTTCTPACPSAKDCTLTIKTSKKYLPDGSLADRKSGFTLLKGCNGTFIFGNKQVGMTTSAASCCEFGMRPLSLETAAKTKCLEQLHKGAIKDSNGRQYWGSLSDLQCPGRWQWCRSKVSVDPSLWLSGPPEAPGMCITLTMGGRGTNLASTSCSNSKAALACESMSSGKPASAAEGSDYFQDNEEEDTTLATTVVTTKKMQTFAKTTLLTTVATEADYFQEVAAKSSPDIKPNSPDVKLNSPDIKPKSTDVKPKSADIKPNSPNTKLIGLEQLESKIQTPDPVKDYFFLDAVTTTKLAPTKSEKVVIKTTTKTPEADKEDDQQEETPVLEEEDPS